MRARRSRSRSSTCCAARRWNTIANKMPTALGEAGAAKATAAIARQMQKLLAADVDLRIGDAAGNQRQARRQRDRRQRRAEEHLPPRRDQVAGRSRSAERARQGERLDHRSDHRRACTASACSGCGSAKPNWSPEAPNSVAVEGTPEVEVEVQNQGESTENGITVVVIANGKETTQEIASLEAGATETAVVPLTPDARRRNDARSRSRTGAGRGIHRPTTKRPTLSTLNSLSE